MADKPYVPLTDDQVNQFVWLADKILAGAQQTGRIPLPAFTVIKHFFPLTAVELVLIRVRNNCPSVYLIPRKGDDNWEDGYQHAPGMMMTNADLSFQAKIDQIRMKELGGLTLPYSVSMVGEPWRMNTKNGPQVLVTYATVVSPSTTISGGKFYPIRALPSLIHQNEAMLLRVTDWLLYRNWGADWPALSEKAFGRFLTANHRLKERVRKLGMLPEQYI